MVTCDQQEKVAPSPKVLLGIFLQIQDLFWRYAELSRLWVGCSKFPFYKQIFVGTPPGFWNSDQLLFSLNNIF